jgi:hypothetical protein
MIFDSVRNGLIQSLRMLSRLTMLIQVARPKLASFVE